MGNICDFRILLPVGGKAIIEWGDGKHNTYTGEGDWLSLVHEYPEKDYKMGVSYHVCIIAEDDILGLWIWDGEVDFMDLTVSNCPTLQYLTCVDIGLTKLDISQNTNLKELDCHNNYYIAELNLDNHYALEVLICKDNQLTALNLTHCNVLRWLVCSNNPLHTIKLSNKSMLAKAIYEDTDLAEKSKFHLLRTLEKNKQSSYPTLRSAMVDHYFYWLCNS